MHGGDISMSWLAETVPLATFTLAQRHDENYGSRQSVFNELPAPGWLLDARGTKLRGNQAWKQFAGSTTDDARPQSWWTSVPEGQREDAKQQWDNRVTDGRPFQLECRLTDLHGNNVWHQLHFAPLTPPIPTAAISKKPEIESSHWIGLLFDIEARRKYQEELECKVRDSQEMLNVSLDCMKLIDLNGNLIAMNRFGCSILGVEPDKVRGTKWMNLLPPSVHPSCRRALADARLGKNARFSGTSVTADGMVCHWDNLLTPLKDEEGNTTSILCVSREISRQRAAEDRLRRASEQDPLTGLLNGKSLRVKMKRMMARARQSGDSLVFISIDLDHFKPVNDSYGHPAGDHLLRVISKRLKRAFQGAGHVARLGGDEFGVVLQVCESEREALPKTLQKKFTGLAAPVWHAHKQINRGLSAGGAIFPNDAQELSEWMRLADFALSQVKSSAKGTIRLFDAKCVDSQFNSLSQASMVQSLLAQELLVVRYAKHVHLHDETSIASFSAELHPPHEYSELVDSNSCKLIHSDGPLATEAAALLRKRVFRDLSMALRQGPLAGPISMKAPIGDLMHQEFANKFLDDLRTHRIPPVAVELEVLESAFHSRSAELSIRSLRTLQAAGVRIVLSDYGMGLVSLVDLGAYPIDKVRLGKEFVARMLCDHSAAAAAKVICELGIALGLEVYADGIDSREQWEHLSEAGCTVGSGKYLGNQYTDTIT